jgi:glycosyltransferase involved in cell wall biosynthesis
MESQMRGTPVVGANIGGIPELIENGKTGELFESGNVDDLVRVIQKLWNDDEYIAKCVKTCKELSRDSLELYTEKLMKIYGGRKEKYM